jgi:CelD/BcsL family acetyltransferase involved in cellulose biosynthesis
MRDFYLRQAQQLAAWQCLSITKLRVNGQLAAYEYGWRSKETFAIMKIGFNESWAHLSPGQLLRRIWLEQVFDEDEAKRVDFVGPLTRATRQWATSQYTVFRTLVGLAGPLHRGAVRAAAWCYARRRKEQGDQALCPAQPQLDADTLEHAHSG